MIETRVLVARSWRYPEPCAHVITRDRVDLSVTFRAPLSRLLDVSSAMMYTKFGKID